MVKLINGFTSHVSRLTLSWFILFFLTCNVQRATCNAQEGDLEFTLDVTSNTVPLPNIFRPNIDLSGRGFHRDACWPQGLAAREVLDTWQKDIGFAGFYRLQYNLWEINQFTKNKDLEESLLGSYENIIKNINAAAGIVILDIFGTPAGLGKILDKTSPPLELKTFKTLVKNRIRDLSCLKKYNIWYEVWTAPDLDGFFLGRKQEYLSLYRQVAESVKELEAEFKVHIPLGGPGVSWWFQNTRGNTIITPERSLIYELIKFCGQNRLPLNFITWHGFSSDPKAEKEITGYNKTAIALIRDWLSYFNFQRDTPLIVDEWNYDRAANILPEREEKAYIGASFIPARLKNMYEAGLDYQLYFSLEDFQNNKEGFARNSGIFWFDPKFSEYKGGPKAMYSVFRMLAMLGKEMFASSLKLNDEFVGSLATKTEDGFTILIYNYLDPEIFQDYLSRNIAHLKDAERKSILKLIKSARLEKIMRKDLDIKKLRLTNKVKALLKKAQELSDQALVLMSSPRQIKINIKNLKENYSYQRYVVDSSCAPECKFLPQEEKEIAAPADGYQETLLLSPYSVNLIILKKIKEVADVAGRG